MSDIRQAHADDPGHAGEAFQGPGSPPTGAGALLRDAREAAGVPMATLAVSLKVPVKKIEALEQERFDLLPDAVFARALAASICRTLKIDAAPVLARLPQTGVPRLAPAQAAINAPFRSPRDGARPAWWTQLSRPVVLTGAALLLGAAVLMAVPSRAPVEPSAGGPPLSDEPARPLPAAMGLALTPDASREQAGQPPTVSNVNQPPAGVAAQGVEGALPVLAAAMPAAAVAEVVSPAAAATDGVLIFRARGESWVEVTDARGAVVLRRLLAAGDVVGASGPLPLSAVVGKADVTEVQVRGKPLDISALARDNVARFEVK